MPELQAEEEWSAALELPDFAEPPEPIALVRSGSPEMPVLPEPPAELDSTGLPVQFPCQHKRHISVCISVNAAAV